MVVERLGDRHDSSHLTGGNDLLERSTLLAGVALRRVLRRRSALLSSRRSMPTSTLLAIRAYVSPTAAPLRSPNALRPESKLDDFTSMSFRC